MLHLFSRQNEQLEYCFNIDTAESLVPEELRILTQILTNGFIPETISQKTVLRGPAVELGPRMSFATAYSTNIVSICHACGLKKISRIERSRRYPVAGIDAEKFIQENHDRMTECAYSEPLSSFKVRTEIDPVYTIPLTEKGPDALLAIPGLAMDEADRNFYYDYFVNQEGRNPTIVEIMDLNNANSEHSRHGYFKGKQTIDGRVMSETLMEIVQSTFKAKPANSLLAFYDNSCVIRGYLTQTILPEDPGKPSPFTRVNIRYHLTLTAETHNFPTGVAPKPGADTGTGGRIRDGKATGQGAEIIAGTAGYCVANLLMPDYDLPWEDPASIYPSDLARPLEIEIQASNGASDYGNKIGEPVIAGFTRSFDLRVPDNQRWAWIKPIMFTGGIGQIDERGLHKGKAEKGMLIVQIGGPAYRIGFGGGAASSKLQGENVAQLDFDAVQRGDAEMEQKANRVLRACAEMGEKNPIVIVHDQGAGGPANVLKELVEKSGGKIEIRRITLGDPTLSVVEIWVAEYQERYGLIIPEDRIEEFRKICKREKVNCEILGKVTGDGRFIIHDEADDSNPVDLDLKKVLGQIPQKTFRDTKLEYSFKPLELPQDITVRDALYRVLRNLAVGSKKFLTNKVDRSVTGLIAQQQCCGPLQLTVGDVAVVGQSHFGKRGIATSIGEQPIKMLLDPEAGARMAVAEALTNMVWAKITRLEDIKCSANWMWAAKLPGEGTAMYGAACAMRDLMIKLGIAVIRGKDSLSMATKVGDEIVKSPRELVISAYAPVPDITKVITPDIKRPGESELIFIDLSGDKIRLGGSVLAQCYSQIGDESPDIDNPNMLKKAFLTVQQLIAKDLILSGHDLSDGGLIVALLEMAFAGNCGLQIGLHGSWNPIEKLFAEEAGLVIECDLKETKKIRDILHSSGLQSFVIAGTKKKKNISIGFNSEVVLKEEMPILRQWWEETSHQIERLQANPKCIDEENKNLSHRCGQRYVIPFEPRKTSPYVLRKTIKPEIAILREEGSNGDREMTSAFCLVGFKPWDVTMTDLIEGRVDLEWFRGLVAVGGFSYADVPESAKGWAATIRFNEKLRKMFEEFFNRKDTFSLGVCNGCQLFTLMGWVPFPGLNDREQPRFVENSSGRFESRWVSVKIYPSPAIMLRGMEDSILGIWVAHGGGRMIFPNEFWLEEVLNKRLDSIHYVNENGSSTDAYPFNPNGSQEGIAALCSPDGRHLAMMPHPERVFLKWQWPWMPENLKKNLKASPWLRMFQNARKWCEQTK